MRIKRYLEKLEFFKEELNFIAPHSICDGITARALLHSVQTCVEISMDIVTMLIKDAELVVEDDYTNIEKLSRMDQGYAISGLGGNARDMEAAQKRGRRL